MGYQSVHLARHVARPEFPFSQSAVAMADVALLDLPLAGGAASFGVVLCPSTYMVRGFHVGPEAAATVLSRAVLNAVDSKSYVPLMYPDVISSWPCDGQIKRLILDHQTDPSLLAVLNGLGIECERARWRPDLKGTIESFFRNLRGALAMFDARPRLAGDSSRAQITLHELRRWVHRWVLDVYHQAPHPRLGIPPLQKWTFERLHRP